MSPLSTVMCLLYLAPARYVNLGSPSGQAFPPHLAFGGAVRDGVAEEFEALVDPGVAAAEQPIEPRLGLRRRRIKASGVPAGRRVASRSLHESGTGLPGHLIQRPLPGRRSADPG